VARRTPDFISFELLGLTRWTVFHQWTRWSSPSKQGSITTTNGTGWDEQLARTHYDVTITSRL